MAYRRPKGFTLGPIGFLIMVNLMLFIIISIRPNLIDLFGLIPIAFLERQWTILTALFIHAPFPRFGHIMANMITLYFFGSYLLRLVGERKFFIIYFGGGILGNILYILLGSPFIPAVGASGAIFALGGALTVLRPRLTVFVFPIPVPMPLWAVVIGGFFILSFVRFVAWQAHLGGLIFGLGMAYFYLRKRYYFK